MRKALVRTVETTLHPLWTATNRIATLIAQVSGELPTALYSPQIADAITRRFYGREGRYRDAQKWQRILFPFEIRMLEKFFPEPPASILLHGAGSGRELTGLRALGYEVTAFEPVRALVDAGNELLSSADSPIQCAAIQHWDCWDSGRYDAAFIGWGVWTHVIREQDRLSSARQAARGMSNRTGPTEFL